MYGAADEAGPSGWGLRCHLAGDVHADYGASHDDGCALAGVSEDRGVDHPLWFGARVDHPVSCLSS